VRVLGPGNAGAAEQDHGRFDPRFLHHHLGLQQLELQPHRAQLVAQQEIEIVIGELVDVRPRLRRVGDLVGGVPVLAGMAKRVASGVLRSSARPRLPHCAGLFQPL
jgi:hypothetical protein